MHQPNPAYTDSKGRTTADRIAAVHRRGDSITERHRVDAMRLLESILFAAGLHGITLEDFDWAIDLPGGCLDVISGKARKS